MNFKGLTSATEWSVIDLNEFIGASKCKNGLETLFMMQSMAEDLEEKNEREQKMLQIQHNFTELRIQEKIKEMLTWEKKI